jgi:hypothetical protein
MEQKILVKHKQAYDTEENWTTNNPILLAGQLAYSSDKYGKYKLGNGTAHWNDLDYCNEKVFTGTRAEYEAANSNGEIKPGTIVNITDDNDYQGIDIDTELSEESENLVTNKAVTTGIKYNDTKDNTTTFLSDDTLEPEGYSDISLLKSSETHSSIFNKLSTMFKNVRYLFGMLGTTDISSIGDGTVTDAISRINTGLSKIHETATFFGDISVFEDVNVWGHGCAIKNTISKRLDLHIQAQITSDGTNTINEHGFINIGKILSMIHVNKISFSAMQSMISVTNQQGGEVINIGNASGFTGLFLNESGNLARIYTDSGSIGAWELRNIRNALQKGLVYNINIYGATYS